LNKSKNLTPEERAKVLEEDEELAKIHQSHALTGQTKVSSLSLSKEKCISFFLLFFFNIFYLFLC